MSHSSFDSIDAIRAARKTLGESLRKLPKPERQALIRDFRTNSPEEYKDVSSVHKRDRRHRMSEEYLKNEVRHVKDLEQLMSMLQKLPDWYEHEGIVHGFLSREHVVKQAQLAILFSCPSIVTASPTLKSVISQHVDMQKHVEKVPDEQYGIYIRERFTEESFTDAEISTIVAKVPIEVWCSIDTEMELPVVLANCNEAVFTTACCSGHDMHKPTARAYLTVQTNDKKFADVVRANNRSRSYLGERGWNELDRFTARSPHEPDDVPFEEAQKGWSFSSFWLPQNDDRARFSSLSSAERRKERDEFVNFLVSTFKQYRDQSRELVS